MTKEEYKELNDYLNDLFIYLDKHYKFILDEMIRIFIINDKYLNHMKQYDLSYKFEENTLTYKDVYDCARKIIESINKEYLPLYDNLIETGQLDFSYNHEYFDSHFYHNRGLNIININRDFNYNDVVTLIHEFFHYLNGRNGRSFTNEILTEFISIYFETYAIKYLLDDGVTKEEIGYLDRLGSTYRRSYELYYIETPLLAYNEFGNLSDDSIDLLNQFFTSSLTKEQFYNECKYLLEYFRKIKNKYTNEKFTNERDSFELQKKYAEDIIYHFKYFFGTMWAFYAINNCDIHDVIYINDHINDDNMTFEICMKKMKIEYDNQDIYEEILEYINKYFETLNIKRK